MKTISIIFLVFTFACLVLSQDLEHVSSSERYKTEVLRVITILDNNFEYTSYEIEFNGIKTTVSPVIALAKYKIGDQIDIMVLKTSMASGNNGKPGKTMSFLMMPSLPGETNKDLSNEIDKNGKEIELLRKQNAELQKYLTK